MEGGHKSAEGCRWRVSLLQQREEVAKQAVCEVLSNEDDVLEIPVSSVAGWVRQASIFPWVLRM